MVFFEHSAAGRLMGVWSSAGQEERGWDASPSLVMGVGLSIGKE